MSVIAPSVSPAPVVLDGTGPTPAQLCALPDGPVPLVVPPAVRAAVTDGHRRSVAVAARRPVYGRTTGVGANRTVDVGEDDRDGHGLRLWRSHAHGTGEPMPRRLVRAAMVVRAAQLAAGMSGLRPDVLDALVRAVCDGRVPTVPGIAAIGTGDLGLLAEVGLALAGERPWADGTVHRELTDVLPEDALPFLSSNCATVASAALAWGDAMALLDAAHVVAAISFVALRGNDEAWHPVVHAAHPHPGSLAVAARMRALVAGAAPAARLQDPYGVRCLPQVHGPYLEALERLEATVAIDLTGAVENPLFPPDADDALHHGGFHHAPLALALEQVRLAAAQVAALSLTRTTKLNDPAFTGQRAFLASGPAGSSGTMMVEYTAAGALADVRTAAAPVCLQGVVLSLGMEDHASFAWQAAQRTHDLHASLRTVLACELVVALRSLRLEGPERPVPPPLAEAVAFAADAVPHLADDHRLTAPLQAAADALAPLGAFGGA